uniref:Uncharacterized protein n=1 Tax=Spongospora subterranea TaxID=70186 RepID=A0A0H5RH51_9EUKA|eukprot:CRZ12872.1 hypothetical protein [Spongospora subterranea]
MSLPKRSMDACVPTLRNWNQKIGNRWRYIFEMEFISLDDKRNQESVTPAQIMFQTQSLTHNEPTLAEGQLKRITPPIWRHILPLWSCGWSYCYRLLLHPIDCRWNHLPSRSVPVTTISLMGSR